MYREVILDLYKHPMHRGELADATHSHREFNASCGDDFTLSLKVTDGKIIDAAFTGTGCVISTASLSLLTDLLIGKGLEEAQALEREALLEELGVDISPSRMKCAMIGLEALRRMEVLRT